MARYTDVVYDENGNVVRNENGTAVTRDDSTLLSRVLTTGANAAAAGWGDEILELFGAQGAAETVRRNEERLSEENPIGNFATQTAGFLVPGTLVGRALGVGARGVRAVTNVARAAKAGAVEGAVAGAGYANEEPISKRVDDALIGAGIGAAAGGVITGATQGAGALVRNRVTRQRREAAQYAANRLGISPEVLLTRLEDGDSIARIALDGANNNRTLAYNNLRDIAKDDNGSILRRLGMNAEERRQLLNNRMAETGGSLRDDLSTTARTSVDDISPDDYADQLVEIRDEVGEVIGQIRKDTDVNEAAGAIVDDIINHPNFGVAAQKQLNNIINEMGALRSSFQIRNADGDVGEFMILTAKQVQELTGNADAKPGIFARKPGVGDADDVIEPAELDLNTFATLVQNLRTKGTGLLDNSAEDASNSTAVGAALTDAADEITNITNRHVPELAEVDGAFVNVDGRKRVFDMVRNSFGSSNSTSGANNRRRLNAMLDGKRQFTNDEGIVEELPNIDRDDLIESVRAGIAERLQSDKVVDFDSSTQAHRLVREAYRRAGRSDEFKELVEQIDVRNSVIQATSDIEKGMASTNPADVGKALRRIFETNRVQEGISQLPSDQAATYREIIENTLEEIRLLDDLSKFATEPIVDTKSWFRASLEQFGFAATVFNTLGKILTVSGLRGARDAGLLNRTGPRQFGLNAEQMTKLLSLESGTIDNALLNEFRTSLQTNNSNDFLQRAFRKAIVMRQVGDPQTGTVVPEDEEVIASAPTEASRATGVPDFGWVSEEQTQNTNTNPTSGDVRFEFTEIYPVQDGNFQRGSGSPF